MISSIPQKSYLKSRSMFLDCHLMEKGFKLSYEMPKIYIGCFTGEFFFQVTNEITKKWESLCFHDTNVLTNEKTFFKELYSFDFCHIKSVWERFFSFFICNCIIAFLCNFNFHKLFHVSYFVGSSRISLQEHPNPTSTPLNPFLQSMKIKN